MRGWRGLVAANGRWYLGSGTWLLLFAFFGFVLGWNTYRSNLASYFPAALVVVLTFSAPSRLRQRIAASRSAAGILRSWWPYLVGLASFAVLLAVFNLAGGPDSQRPVAAGYIAMAVLIGCLGSEGHIRHSLLVALLTSRLPSRGQS
jgi:hypothetical protein